MKKSLFAVLVTACLCMSVKGEDSAPPEDSSRRVGLCLG